MKDTILQKLNNLRNNDYLINFPQKNETVWTLALFQEDLLIKFSSVLGSPNLINFTFEKDKPLHNEEISVVLEQEQLQPFFTQLRKVIAGKFGIRTCDEEKRKELLQIMKQANNVSPGRKEELVIIDDNEKKTYFFRNTDLYKQYSVKELSNIDFYTFSISEMIKDKRLNETVPSIKQYEIFISNSEFCEIFNINLEKEKQLLFDKSFDNFFPQEITNNIVVEQKTNKTQEQVEPTVTSKIKKIL